MVHKVKRNEAERTLSRARKKRMRRALQKRKKKSVEKC
jgi:hypothetical protein